MLRRDFLKLSATASAVSCVTACGSKSSESPVTPPPASPEQVDWTSCTCNCQANCPIKVISRDGVAIRIESDNEGDDSPTNLKSMACLRGRASRQKMYAADRLKVPMKRVGKRGEGLFEEISWDEAYQMIADNLSRIIAEHGNDAIFWPQSSGRTMSPAMTEGWPKRLLNLTGGFVDHFASYSNAQIAEATIATHGWSFPAVNDTSSSEMANSDLIVAFGYNPAETRMSGTGQAYDTTLYAKNTPMILVDPRYTDSALGKEDTWLPIRPGTDAALVEAIIYQLVVSGRVDDAWVDKYCTGWTADSLPEGAPANGDYRSYILGQGEDGIAKTPAYAAAITGLPEEQIIEVARRIGEAERPFICQGYGVQRHANGEQSSRAIFVLPWVLGKVGIPGTSGGGWPGFNGESYSLYGMIPEGENKIAANIRVFKWLDGVTDGANQTATKDGVMFAPGLKSNFKFVWNYAGNILINQHSDVLGTKKILEDESLLEFILVHDYAMTPTAMFADLLLPDKIDMQIQDVASNPGAQQETVFLTSSSLKPFYKAKDAFEVCSGVAEKLGLKEQFTEGLTYEQWIERMYKGRAEGIPYLPSFEELKEKRKIKVSKTVAHIAFQDYVRDPVSNPMYTPSGKIEIYSLRLAEHAKTWELPEGDVITALPQYVKTWEGAEDEETKKEYPLQLIGYHTKGRVHSSFHNLPWLREVAEDAVWMNPIDAQARGISGGEQVIVRSMRGRVKVRVKVTPRIRPGVAALAQGAWSKFEGDLDVGGNINTLTKHHPSPMAKGNPQHTNLVEIALA